MSISKIETLEQWQKNYPNGFKSIALDISGFCNAKCKYCPAGNDLSHKGEFISPEKYEALLNKIQEYKMYSVNTDFHIYCLGEPLMHPQFNEILKLTGKHEIYTNVSTNASVVPQVNQDGLKAVRRVLISMPGFSQASYDKIHGFSFEQIKKNIIELKKRFVDIPFDMTYHIYQFNMNEMEDARRFCMEYDIRFAPNYAVLFDRNKCMSYVSNTMPYEELKDISKELFLSVLDHQIANAPKNYCDLQNNYLSINIDGDIRICSCFTKGYEPNILCGNLLHDNINKILQRKYSHEICVKCIDAGLTVTEGYDCKSFPDYYYSMLKEKDFLNDKAEEYIPVEVKQQMKQEIVLMHQIRAWENDHYSQTHLQKIIDLLQTQSYQIDQIKSIVLKYGRFGEKTIEKLLPEIINSVKHGGAKK